MLVPVPLSLSLPLTHWLKKMSTCQLSAGDERVEESSVSFVTFSSPPMQQSAAGQTQDLTTDALSGAV